ncbi:hypothetical protein MNBD_GAMMA26-1889 [hydrothermal vent metagenome]|uniref:DUF2191 domain-containing protein n=1 Tax=hydrothermal vent metagenome TaxID=652676 RepID=A0A3B1AZV5_9ZZZZ
MRTTLNLDDSLIHDILDCTREQSKTKAITIALKDYLRRKNIENILSLQGNLDIEDNWKELEQEEMREYASK